MAAWHQAAAQPGHEASPITPVEQFDDALLAAMRAGASSSFEARYRALEPVIARAFNLDAVPADSIGAYWANVPDDEMAGLVRAFRRYTVSSYAASFNSYNSKSFRVLPSMHKVSNDEAVVQTRLLRVNGSPIKLDYVVRRGTAGWQIVDVLTNGSSSRVAVPRSDFRQLLKSGDVPTLTTAPTGRWLPSSAECGHEYHQPVSMPRRPASGSAWVKRSSQ